MITNDRQYRITKAQLRKLKEAAEAFDAGEAKERTQPAVIAKAELAALRSEVDNLSEQIREYESLKSGAVSTLNASSLDELPMVLIRARIARQLTQRELADALGLKEQQVQRYEAECYSSASFRRLTEVAKALELDISEFAELAAPITKAPDEKQDEMPWDRFPVKEMYRRHWFTDFTGSLSAAMTCGDELVRDFVQRAMPRRRPALLRQRARSGGDMDTYGLLAWQCRILMLSRTEEGIGGFDRKRLTEEWFCELVQKSRHDDGPKQAKDYLASSGIPLVFEPHLARTYLDGAVFLLPNRSPVIGMTLRYDRLDNFWFVLFHELAHVVKHLRRGKLEDIFDDLDAEGDDLERKADAFAGSMLMPDDKWETALARYVRSKESVEEFAAELSISPAIVAGRIRKEADNYVVLTELVGQGEVRKHFSEVRFGQ